MDAPREPSKERSLYLVRHGETVDGSSVRFFGRTDVALSDVGRQQVRGLAPLVRHVVFEAVVHSPLSRARESAEILTAALREPPTVTEEAPDLIEVDFGDIEGLTEREIATRMPIWYRQWRSGAAAGFPGGETFAGFNERMVAAVDGLLARHPVGNLLVVVHKGVIRRALAHLLGLSRDAATKINLDLGSLSIVACSDRHQLLLKHLNLTADGS
ncbi:MAG: histidine phosphatase family protein [Planctomycetota bacterium]|jgi:broad specificity phosphatase PhoE